MLPLWSVLAAALVLAGCASGPKGGADGPPRQPPSGVDGTPDAEPRIEPLRSGGPNKPYEVLGQRYTPLTRDVPLKQQGLASWYGRKFHGRPTASGEVYNMYGMTAAHKTMPLPSYARVRNPANGREIIVRINDRGPFHGSRIIDLSYAAAARLGTLKGVVPVEVERLTHDEIRAGTWRRPSPGEPAGSQVFAATPPATGAAPDAGSAAVVATLPGTVAGTTGTGTSPSAGTGSSTSPGADANGGATAAARVTASPTEPGPDDAPAPAATEALVPARATPIETVRGDAAPTVAARGFWVQLGAFRERGGAESFQQRVVAELDWLSPLLAVFADAPLYRLQAGPYPSRDEAQGAAQRVREALQLVPVIIERR